MINWNLWMKPKIREISIKTFVLRKNCIINNKFINKFKLWKNYYNFCITFYWNYVFKILCYKNNIILKIYLIDAETFLIFNWSNIFLKSNCFIIYWTMIYIEYNISQCFKYSQQYNSILNIYKVIICLQFTNRIKKVCSSKKE